MAKNKWILMIPAGVLSIFSCTNPSNYNLREPESKDSLPTKQKVTLDLCSLNSTSSDSIADVLINEEERLTVSSMTNDDCAIEVINKLAAIPSATNYKALDIFASKSDGYLSDALMDTSVDLLEADARGFLDYLSTKQDGPLFNSLVNGLSMKLSMEKTTLHSLKSHLSSKLVTDLQQKTLNSIFEKVDPKKFD
jgi:hypothetical protein